MTESAAAAAEPRWLSDEEQRMWRAYLSTHRLLIHRLGRDLQSHGLTVNDHEILVNLSEAPDRRMRMTALADATLLSKSRLSHQITRMEAAGLVRRQTCEEDGRGLLAVLTEHGWETMQQITPVHVAGVREHFLDRLTEQQKRALGEAFGPLAEYLCSVTDVRT